MQRARIVQLLTASRVLLAAVFAVVITQVPHTVVSLFGCLLLVSVIETSDLVDGHLARRWNVVSEFGKMFDPYCDAVSRLVVYWALSTVGLCFAVVPLVMAARDVTVAYIRALLTGAGRDPSARWLGKTKAVVHGVTSLLLLAVAIVLPSWSKYFVAPASILVMGLSLAAGLDHVVAAWPQISAKLRAVK
jgi:CDP-diacylglycerol---glycerol-3-phosphate 3-phosphatidyltransferase